MPVMTAHEPGMLCWADLSTTDAAAAKRFYTELFGWKPNDMPTPEGPYTMLEVDGKAAAALMQSTKTPPHWNCYIAVTSADAAAKKVTEAGGELVSPPFDVFDAGRMFVAKDPTGAIISGWEAKRSIGAYWMNDPGGLCWAELMTPDPAKAGKFYAHVFGWTADTQDMGGGMVYTVFKSGGKQAVGMFETPPDMKNVPPNWTPVFAVADCDAIAQKAKGLGAAILMDPMDIPGVGRYAAIKHPQGGVFTILRAAR